MSGPRTMGESLLFDAFWAAYPRKRAKLHARKAFEKAGPTPELLERILSALDWQRQQPQWTKEHGQYIPYPASYLNGGCWDDEPLETVMSDHEFFRVHGYRRPR